MKNSPVSNLTSILNSLAPSFSPGDVEDEIARFDGEEPGLFDRFVSPVGVRALNLDDHRDVAPLEEFLSRCRQENGGSSFLVPEMSYLQGEVEDFENLDKILSLVVAADSEILAHVALRFDSLDTAEIVATAVHPSHRDYSFRFARLLWRKIQKLAAEQNWKAVYQFNRAADSCLQAVGSRCFESSEMALIPDTSEEGAGGLLLLLHTFRDPEEDYRTVYPASAHAGKVQELFQFAGLQRAYASAEFRRVIVNQNSTFPIRRRVRAATGVDEVTVIPSAIGTGDDVFTYLSDCLTRVNQEKNLLLIRVPLDEPESIKFAEELESKGFRFCGVLPAVEGRDWSLFSKFENEHLNHFNLYSVRANELRDYLRC